VSTESLPPPGYEGLGLSAHMSVLKIVRPSV
jgi:hypothetical protein